MGPAKMPADITKRLNAEIGAILKAPDVAAKIHEQGGEIMGGSPEEFARFIASDSAAFAKLVKEANIKLD
jgi:tripartite-type tricarboxylate transporter receptor subunit TctC